MHLPHGFRAWVTVILVLGLLVRVGVVLATDDYALVADTADYHRHAISIESGNGYPTSEVASGGGPTAFRPPFYPYFLAAVYFVTAPEIPAARLAQAIVGTITVALIGLLALMIWGRRTALVSMAIAAVYPPLLVSGAALISEALFLPLALGALATALQSRRSGDPLGWALLAGLLLGLATLTRPNGFVLALPVLLALWQPPRPSARALVLPGAAMAAAVLSVVPWTIRNAVEMDTFVPVSTQAGYNLAGTYNEISREDPEYPGAWRPPSLVPEYRPLFVPGARLDEVETEKRLREGGVDYLTDHPAYVLRAGFWNTVRMLELTGFSFGETVARDIGIGKRFADLSIVAFWALGLLALAGCFTSRARAAPASFWISIAALVLSVVFISGTTRYRAPLEPFVVILSALALEAGWERLRERGGRGIPGVRRAQRS